MSSSDPLHPFGPPGSPPPPPRPPGSSPLPPPAASPPAYVPAAAPGQMTLPPGVTVTDPLMRFVAYLLEGLLLFVTFGIGWAIWAAIISGGGQTPAKKLIGQRVIYTDGRGPAGFATMFFLRWLVAGFVAFFAILFTFGILLFMPFWDRRNQNIWDKVSGTVVVDDRDNAWSVV